MKRFLESGRTGLYFSVLEEGRIAAGDAIERVRQGTQRFAVADVTRLYTRRRSRSAPDRRVAAYAGSWTGSGPSCVRRGQRRRTASQSTKVTYRAMNVKNGAAIVR